ncbi:MAG TPA: branched-chain amino acid ABC transporter permease [Ktedonobacterales bacterium]|nr:branched-chain amino acid ABC transporter permease [Ktedonobacterales bacterium]
MSAATPASATMPPATLAAPSRLLGTARARALLVVGILALGLVFLFGGDGLLSILDFTLIAAIATLGLNVLSGYTGQISLGISFFMAIGAYTAAWLGGDPPAGPHDPVGLGLSFLIWLPAAGIVAALAGALIGPTALRLKGFYLAIVTLALVFIGYYIFTNVRAVTGGPQGRSFPAPSFGSFSFASPDPIFGLQLSSNQVYLLLILLVLTLAGLFVANVMRSRAGRALQAVRDNEVGATIMGVNLFQAKIGAFVLSSFLAGIAGALWASYPGFAEPNSWGLLLSIEFVAAMLVGGVASVWGSILGAGFVFALQQTLNNLLPQSASATGISGGVVSAILYGLLIIGFLLFEPAGVIGLIRRIQFMIRRFDERRKGGESTQTMVVSDPESQFDIESARVSRETEGGG